MVHVLISAGIARLVVYARLLPIARGQLKQPCLLNSAVWSLLLDFFHWACLHVSAKNPSREVAAKAEIRLQTVSAQRVQHCHLDNLDCTSEVLGFGPSSGSSVGSLDAHGG